MIEILKSVPFFAHLENSDLEAISSKVKMEYYPSDYTIFSEGSPGDIMYILKSGSAQVLRGHAIIAELPAGSFFGEMALVSDEPRNATVKTTSDVELLTLAKGDFKHLLEINPKIAEMISYEVVSRSD